MNDNKNRETHVNNRIYTYVYAKTQKYACIKTHMIILIFSLGKHAFVFFSVFSSIIFDGLSSILI